MQKISPHFISRLRQLLGPRLLTQDEALRRYSKDETAGAASYLPQLVALAQTTDEVAIISRLCSEYGVFLTPWGAGTGKSGGAMAVAGGLTLSLELMNRIILVDAINGIAKVEPGVILGNFQSHLEHLKLFYPPDPASSKWCSMGGNVAENAGGPSALKYGVTRNYLLGLEAVLMSGEVIRCGHDTMKGVSGYDLVGLLCGSEGTLAIITEITLRVLAQPAWIFTALVAFPSDSQTATAVANILAQGLVPRALEYMDHLSLSAMAEAKTLLPDARAALIIECDGMHEEATMAELKSAITLAEQAGANYSLVASDADKRRQIWNFRRGLSEATRKIRKYKVSEDIVVPRAKIQEMVAFVSTLASKYQWYTCSYGHAGDGNLHVQILFDQEDSHKLRAILSELFIKTLEFGGTLSGEHGIGVAKKDFLSLEQSSELINLQKRVKYAFDPRGLLNPEKIF